MWRDLNAHLMRTLDPAVLQLLDALYPDAGQNWWRAMDLAVAPAVDGWIASRILANATPRGLRPRIITEIACAIPDPWDREPFDFDIVPHRLIPAVRGAIHERQRWWLRRSAQFWLSA